MAKITTTNESGGQFEEPSRPGEFGFENVLDEVNFLAEKNLTGGVEPTIAERALQGYKEKKARQESAPDPRQQFDQAKHEYEHIVGALRQESADSNPQLETSRAQLNRAWGVLMDEFKKFTQHSSYGNETNEDGRVFIGFVHGTRDIFTIIRQRHKITTE